MILMVPINGFVATATRKLQIKQMLNKDKRVKMMNEILSGIKVSFSFLSLRNADAPRHQVPY